MIFAHLSAPAFAGTTLPVARNALSSAPDLAPAPATGPVFDAGTIEMHRRMRFNPLRSLTPEVLSTAHDQFDLGLLSPAARLWEAMCRRDETLSFVKPQLEDSIASKPWGVFKVKDADPVEAARHEAALNHFYNSVRAVNALDRNERGGRTLLLKQMASSDSFFYAVHHFVWKPEPDKTVDVPDAEPVPALSAELEFVPLHFFDNTTGTLRFQRLGMYAGTGDDLNWDGEWMVTTGRGIMFAAAACYVFKRLTFQDWTIFNERYAQQKVVGVTNAQKDSEPGRAMEQLVADFNGDQGIVIYESNATDKPPIHLLGPEGTVSVDLFERFLDRQDRKITVMYRGSDLANMSREKDVTGVSAQTEETERLEIAQCRRIADACQQFIDRKVIEYCFGAGVEPLAYFGLPDLDQEDAKQVRDSAGFLADRGVLVDANDIAERLGITITKKPEEALSAVAGTAQEDSVDGTKLTPPTKDQTTATNIARLQRIVEETLAENNNPYHDPGTGEFSSGGGGGSREREFAIRANLQRGRNAMRRVMAEGRDVVNAMQRPDVGDIDFIWERAGGSGKTYGIKHLLDRRAQEDHAVGSALSPEETAEKMVEVIARGSVVDAGRKKGVIEIDHEGFRAVLASAGKDSNAWLITGFEKRAGSTAQEKKGNR